MFTIKYFEMFYKKRQWVAPAWWTALNRKQNMYARRLADWLGRKTVRIPAARLRVYLVLFLIGMAGLELGGAYYSIRQGNAVVPYGRSVQVVLPPPRPRARGSDFGRFMDSLRRNPAFDSFLRARPGLADTLRRVEEWER